MSRTIFAGAAVLVACVVLAMTPVVNRATRGWVRSDEIRPPLAAVVVLSGGLKPDSALGAEGTERLLTGLEVLREAPAPRLVTTRVRNFFNGSQISSDWGQRQLVHLARADSMWSTVDSVFTTRDEAVKVARLLLPANRRIALVTSPMHTRRACATFEAVGFQVTCVPAREIDNITANPRSVADRLATCHAYLYERLAMIKYRAKGWVQ